MRTTEGRWRELFLRADAISEGSLKDEAEGQVWYGSTSLILTIPTGFPEEESGFLRAIAARDVHVRLHALRWATREAQSRAPGMLGRAACDVRFCDDPRGLRIDVDIQAPLIERRRIRRSIQ